MKVLSSVKAPVYRGPQGTTSYLLASPLTSRGMHLTTTVVQITPGGEQPVHSHAPEQVYFVLEGSGLMTVGGETRDVEPGDCVFIPSETRHGIRNQGQGVLRYFSAAAPAFDTRNMVALRSMGGEGEGGKCAEG